MKCMVMFRYSIICDMHFDIMKSELILGISVRFFKFLAINYSSSMIPLFANKKKDLFRIKLTFLQEVSIIVRVNMKPRR